jgi:hypothetical protein
MTMKKELKYAKEIAENTIPDTLKFTKKRKIWFPEF